MGTLIDYKQRGHGGCRQRWERTHRAALLDQYRALQAEGVSQRQAAKMLQIPRTTLQAWHVWHRVIQFSKAIPMSAKACNG